MIKIIKKNHIFRPWKPVDGSDDSNNSISSYDHTFFHKLPMGIKSGSKHTSSIIDVHMAIMLSVIRDGGVNSGNDNNQQISIEVDFNYLFALKLEALTP